MIKRFIYYLLVLLTITFSSCQKHEENFHRVRFHLTFKEVPPVGVSDFIDVTCKPNYENEPPQIYKDYITPGYEWDYEFWQLKDGDKIEVNLKKGEIKNITKGKIYKSESYPAFMERIIKTGGLINLLKREL